MEETTKLGKFLYKLIDAMFWVVDETTRWWEISKISIQIKTFRRQKAALNKLIKENERNSIGVTVAQTAELANLNESISKLSSKEDLLKSKSWSWSPCIAFLFIFVLFLYGVLSINPIQNVIDRYRTSIGVFGGQISRVRELPFQGHSIISDSIWFNNRLYVAGNNGVTQIDTVSGQSENLKDLPTDFFAKDMQLINNRLLIAGYSGMYEYVDNKIKSLFPENVLSKKLVNSFAVVNEMKKVYLIGVLGEGIFRTSGDNIKPISDTKDYIVKSFGHQKKELWILHEEGILIGSTEKLSNIDLQVLAGKKPRCMITTDKNVFIGTDQGIVAGYRSAKNWVWTMLSSTKPGFINDITNAGDILFIASDEGVFRYYKGKMDRLSSIPTYSLCLCDTFLAAVGKTSVLLYYFDFSGNIANNSIFGVVPELGTYTPTLPITTLPMGSRPIYKRMPDYGLMDTDGKEALSESAALSEKFSPDKKPMIELPIELQRPVFSDITKFNDKYYLATTNRGIWSFDNKTWKQIKHNGNGNSNKLCCNLNHCYAYSDKYGVYEIINDEAVMVLNSKDSVNLKYVTISDDNSLLLFYSDGKVNLFKDGELSQLFNIPGEFIDSCHSIWKVSGQYVAILNQGIMTYESNSKWNLMFFQGNIDSARIADVCNYDNKVIYIALNDGRIFEYFNNKLPISGIVPDHPVSINFSKNLWVSSADSLYVRKNNSFVSVPFKSNDKILEVFADTDKNSKNVLVFTASGLRIISL